MKFSMKGKRRRKFFCALLAALTVLVMTPGSALAGPAEYVYADETTSVSAENAKKPDGSQAHQGLETSAAKSVPAKAEKDTSDPQDGIRFRVRTQGDMISIGLKAGNGKAHIQLRSGDGAVVQEWDTALDDICTVDTSKLKAGQTYKLHCTENNCTTVFDDPNGDHSETFSLCHPYDVTFTAKEGDHGIYADELKTKVSFFKIGDIGTALSKPVTEDDLNQVSKEASYPLRNGNCINMQCVLKTTTVFGENTLGNAGDKNEYFEITLTIPNGIPGQVMKVDLSKAEKNVKWDGNSYTNPSVLTVEDDGTFTQSFWVKDGQSITIDGLPLLFPDYYTLSENNEIMNNEAYATHILVNEDFNLGYTDSILGRSIELIGAKPGIPDFGDDVWEPMMTKAKAPKANKTTMFEAWLNGLKENDFAPESPAVDTSSHDGSLLDVFGFGRPFYVNDSLSANPRTSTSRSATKITPAPEKDQKDNRLVPNYFIAGNSRVLFMNVREGVSISKIDNGGNPVVGAKLQILDKDGNVVSDFTSTKDGEVFVTLIDGSYTLHEVSAPENYGKTGDISFIVTDGKTQVDGRDVNTVTMTDRAYRDISVEKVWKSVGGDTAKHPDSVTVKLLADGEEKSSCTLSDKKNWKFTFEDVDKYDESGKEIEYTVTEDPVDGYNTDISGNAESGFTITNTAEEAPKPNGNDSKTDKNGKESGHPTRGSSSVKTGDDTSLYGYGALGFLAAAGVLMLTMARMRRKTREKE